MDLRDMPGLGGGLDLGNGGEKGMWVTPKSLWCGTGWMVAPLMGQETLKLIRFKNYQTSGHLGGSIG